MMTTEDSERTSRLVPRSGFVNAAISSFASLASIAFVASSAYLSYRFDLGTLAVILIPFNVLLLYGLLFVGYHIQSQGRKLRLLEDRIIESAISLHDHSDRIEKVVTAMLRDSHEELRAGIDRQKLIASGEQDNHLSVGSVELYLSYKGLGVAHLGDILRITERLFHLMYGLSTFDEGSWTDEQMQDYPARILERLRSRPQDQIGIESIHTSESVRIRIKTGWLPSFAIDREDFIVGLPKGATVLVILGYMLSSAISYSVSTAKDALEAAKAYRELRISEKQEKKLDLELEELQRKLSEAPRGVRESVDSALLDFLGRTVRDEEIHAVRVTIGNHGEK